MRNMRCSTIPVLALIAFSLAPAAAAQPDEMTLPRAVEAALGEDPLVLAAIAARAGVEAGRAEAAAARRPSLDTEISAGVRRLENATRRNLGIADDVLFPLELYGQAEWTFADFGRTAAELARFDALAEAADLRVAGTGQNTALTVAREYLLVQQQQDVVTAARANVVSHETLAGLLRRSVDEGLTGLPELQLTEQRLESARIRLLEAEQALLDARETLTLIAGPLPAELAPAPDPAPALAGDPIALRAVAVDASPAVRAAAAEARAAARGVDAARAELRPEVGVDLTTRAGEDIDGFQGFTNDVRGRVFVRLPLIDGGARDARLRAAIARADEAAARAAATRREAEIELIGTLNSWQSLDRVVAANAREVTATQGLLESYRAQFEANRRSLLEVFEAQDMVLMARIRELASRYARTQAGYRALAAQERLLQFFGVTGGSSDIFVP